MDFKFRLKAFLWHLSASVVLALMAIAIVFYYWYPAPLAEATGVISIFLLLLIIDVVLGPLVTFIIAKPGKKSLKIDMAIIITIQLAAFIYGMSVVADGRPVWLVYNKGQVDLVQAYQLNNSYRDNASEDYRRKGWVGPQWVSAKSPEDPVARNTLFFESLSLGIDLPQRPDLYAPFSAESAEIEHAAKAVGTLYLFNKKDKVDEQLRQWPQADAYLPLVAPVQSMVVLIDRANSEVFAIVPLNPY